MIWASFARLTLPLYLDNKRQGFKKPKIVKQLKNQETPTKSMWLIWKKRLNNWEKKYRFLEKFVGNAKGNFKNLRTIKVAWVTSKQMKGLSVKRCLVLRRTISCTLERNPTYSIFTIFNKSPLWELRIAVTIIPIWKWCFSFAW